MAKSTYQDDMRASLAALSGGSAKDRLARLGKHAVQRNDDVSAAAQEPETWQEAPAFAPAAPVETCAPPTRTDDRTPDRSNDHADVRVEVRSDDRSSASVRADVRTEVRSDDRTDSRTDDRTIDRSDYRTLTQKQRDVLCFLYGLGGALIMCREIAEATGLKSDEAARGQVKQLSRKGLLRFSKGRQDARQGLRCELTEAGILLARSIPRSIIRTDNRTGDRSIHRTDERASDRVRDRSEPLLERKKDEDFLTIAERLEGMKPEDFAAFWPHLESIGFGVAKAREVTRKRQAAGKSLDQLLVGLDHADAAVGLGLEKMAGKTVDKPLAYVYAPLMRDGYFDRPSGWLTPEERAAKDAEASAKQAKEARERMEASWLEAWLARLDPEQERTILAAAPGYKDPSRMQPDAKARTLRLHWIKLGKPKE